MWKLRGPMLGLNLDVWCCILRNCESVDAISALSRTCRQLHEQGARELLRQGVVLRDSDDALSFQLFLDADPGRRIPQTKCVSFGTRRLGGPDAEVIVQLLQKCTSIERLRFADGATLEEDAEVGESLSQLVHIKEFGLGSLPEDLGVWMSISSRMRSRCTQLILNDWAVSTENWWPSDGFDVQQSASSLGQAFTTSLESLRVQRIEFVANMPIVAYPNLTKLEISELVPRYTKPKALMESFPALRELAVYDEWLAVTEDVVKQLRQGNLATARLSRNGWKELDSIRMEFSTLYLLGLPCPARRCMVTPDQYLRDLDLSYLLAVLRDMQFTRLSLNIDSRKCWLVPFLAKKIAAQPGSHPDALTVNVVLKYCGPDDIRRLLVR